MEALIAAFVPTVTAGLVYLIVAGVKKAQSIKYSDNKKAILRPLAALLSFGGVVTGAIITGEAVDQTLVVDIVNVLVSSVLAYVGATGVHELRNG